MNLQELLLGGGGVLALVMTQARGARCKLPGNRLNLEVLYDCKMGKGGGYSRR